MQKRIMILGAGAAQLNLIKCAKEQNYFTIVCDMRPEMEGSQIADQYYQVNYMDQQAVLSVANKERIDGVISNSEPAMSSVSYLVDQMHLPGNSTQSLDNLLSKTKFRELQKKVGVFSPESVTSGILEEILEQAEQLRFPIMIKPAESSGSRGATEIMHYDPEQISAAFYLCQSFSRNNQVTAEEFVKMESLDVVNADVFVIGEEILWDGWYGGLRSARKPMIPMAKVLPPDLSQERMHRIKNDVNSLLRASGVSLGEFNVETYFSDRGELFVIEINPRQAGNDIPKLILEHTGVDLTKLLVTLTVGDFTYYNHLKNYRRINRLITLQVVFCEQDGVYRGLQIDERIRPFVRWIREFVKPGDRVYDARNATDAVAYVDLEFDTTEQQNYFTRRIEEVIRAKVDQE